MRIVAVIMAGGRGQRFWPKSREDFPKQFLALHHTETLIQRTCQRLEGICAPEDVWVVTHQDYADIVKEQLPRISSNRMIYEPQGRDTAPCIALASMHVDHVDSDSVMVVLPSDHLILDDSRFQAAILAAVEVATESDCLVTLGIKPTRPETGYGYIRQGNSLGTKLGHSVCEALAFEEKPSLDTALRYLHSGDFLWNSGIFVWRVSSIISAIKEHLPEVWELLQPVRDAVGSPNAAINLAEVYSTLPKISIDYGVMERARNVRVLPVDFAWDDLGTWSALERMLPADQDGNVVSGNVLSIETATSILDNQDDRLLVTFGVNNVLVVSTDDVILVADKTKLKDVRTVVQRLEVEGLEQHLRRPSHQGEGR